MKNPVNAVTALTYLFLIYLSVKQSSVNESIENGRAMQHQSMYLLDLQMTSSFVCETKGQLPLELLIGLSDSIGPIAKNRTVLMMIKVSRNMKPIVFLLRFFSSASLVILSAVIGMRLSS
jgi:hypothetical protein